MSVRSVVFIHHSGVVFYAIVVVIVLARHSIANTETFWNKQPKSIELVYNIVPYLADFGIEYITTALTTESDDIPM